MGVYSPGFCGFERGIVVVASTSPASTATPSAGISSHIRLPAGDDIQAGGGSGDGPSPVAVAPLHRPEEGHGQASGHSRSVCPEPIHPLSSLQNVDHSGCETPPATGVSHGLARLNGWVLARADSSCQTPLPGVPLPRDRLLVPGSPIRPQCSPQDFHQTGDRSSPRNFESGHIYTRLSRRPARSRSLTIDLPRSSDGSPRSPLSPRLDHQLEEVAAHTRPVLPVAGSSMGPSALPSQPYRPMSGTLAPVGERSHVASHGLSQAGHASPGPFQLGRSHRFQRPALHVRDEERISTDQRPLPGLPVCPSSLVPVGSRISTELTVHTPAAGRSLSPASYNDRRLRGGVGDRFPPLPLLRSVRSVPTSGRHCPERTTHDFLGFASCTPTQQCPGAYRLSCVSSGPPQGGFAQPSPGPVVSGGLASCLQQVHQPAPLFPPRQLQRTGGSVIQRSDHLHGVVHQRPRFSKSSRTSRISAPNRPLCHRSQQPLRSVHVPLPRSPSSGNRRVQPLLGHLGQAVSVPPDSVDFEGFSEAATNSFRRSDLCVPRAGRPGLVLGPVLPSSQIVQAVITPTTARAGLPCSPTGSDASDRVHFVREHFSYLFPDDPLTAELMSLPIRPSSARVYQSHWIVFLDFLRREGVVSLSQCTLRHAVKFLTLLFKQRDIIASTVAHYRSALSYPLRAVLNIDLLHPAVSAMLKAMSLRRPSRPLTAPSWNLQRVLDYLEGLPAHISHDDALARAAFLVLLCTGWRISELQACVRLSDYCLITQDGGLRIRPHEAFLAKNELSHSRWPHSVISPLFNDDGSRSRLCPVQNLQHYLNCSEPSSVGPLFTSRSGSPLSIFMLSRLICRIVLKGDPFAKVKVHDIRKFASSLSLMQHMDVKELLNAMRWKSSSAFFRHYLILTPRPTQAVLVPGGTIAADEVVDDPQAGPSGV